MRSSALFIAAALVLSIARPSAAGSEPPAASARSAVAEAMTADELERMLLRATEGETERRRAAAKEIESLGQDAVPVVTAKLAELRKSPSATVHVAVKQVKEAKEHKGEIDLVEGLLQKEGIGPKAALSTVLLLRALAHAGTTDAVRPMLLVVLDHNGTFRSEVTRLVKVLGDRAVPALILTRKESSTELRRWAFTQLEGMGKRIPGDAVQTRDNQVLADVLRAYAEVHEIDALPVILSFVSSDRIQVRSAARDAIGKYGQDAIWKLREAYSNVTGKNAVDGWTAADVARELFAAYDRLRLQEVYGLLDEGLAKHEDGKLEEAVAAFDKVLARQPLLDRRAEMVPAFVAYAQSVEDADPTKALAIFRKAARLAPDGPRTNEIQAEIAYLEGKELLARGIADTEPFKRALEKNPSHDKARAELARLEQNVEERQERLRALALGGVVLFVAIAAILLFVGRRSPKRARAS